MLETTIVGSPATDCAFSCRNQSYTLRDPSPSSKPCDKSNGTLLFITEKIFILIRHGEEFRKIWVTDLYGNSDVVHAWVTRRGSRRVIRICRSIFKLFSSPNDEKLILADRTFSPRFSFRNVIVEITNN